MFQWAHVTVPPDPKRIAVFRRGRRRGFRGLIPVGGQKTPTQTSGAKLLWKNDQKKPKKKNTSEVINSAIPHRSPSRTSFVWMPIYVLSQVISFHHLKTTQDRINILSKSSHFLFMWRNLSNLRATTMVERAVQNGQGDSFTRWLGWRIILVIIILENLISGFCFQNK